MSDVWDRILGTDDAAGGGGGGAAASGLVLGVVVGVVTNVKDPDGLGRVRVKLPWLIDSYETDWARVTAPFAGNRRGAQFQLQVDDEVLVAFEHGDVGRAVVIGSLWNGKDKPPAANPDGKSDVQTIRSRSGHVIRLVDEDGKERIEIVDKSTKDTIVIDAAEQTITVTGEKGVVVEAKNGPLTLRGRGITIDSSQAVTVKGKTGVTVQSDASTTVKGATVAVEASARLAASGGIAEVSAKGPLALKGAVIELN